MRWLVLLMLIPALAGVSRADEADDAWRKAEEAAKGGRYEEAIASYQQGLAKRKDVAAYVGLGNACMQAGRPPDAEDAYGQALRMDASCEAALANLAHACDAAGDRAEALRALQRLLDLRPRDLDLRDELAGLLSSAGRVAEARTLLESTLALAPTRAATWRLLGEAFAREGKREEAVTRIEIAARLGVNDRQLFQLLGDIYLGMKMPAEALTAYRRAEKTPGTTTAEDDLRTGAAADEAGDDEGAIASYRAAIAAAPADKNIVLAADEGLVRVLVRGGHAAEAAEVLKSATALDPANPVIDRMKHDLEGNK